MWPLIVAGIRTYAPYVTFPVAFVVGAFGFYVERTWRSDKQPGRASIAEEREERLLAAYADKDCTEVDSLKARKDIPHTVLDRNPLSK